MGSAQAQSEPDAPAATAPSAQDRSVRRDTPSGLPVPRLVSLKAKKTYCRAGPSFQHPVRLTFMRQRLPVLVIAETRDHWRKIRDLEGDECWTHRSKLSGAETALVTREGLTLHAHPEEAAPVKARLAQGVIAKVDRRRDGWLRISANGVKGWAPAAGFWGARADAPLAFADPD
ncbi:MAG: SH3 domain-containing protein [Pseudomonadota bacterium]